VSLTIAAIGWLAFVSYSFVFTPLLPDPVAYLQFPWRALAPFTAVAAMLWFGLVHGRRHGTAILVVLGVLAAVSVPGLQRNVVDRPDQVDSCFTSADVRHPTDSPGSTCFVRGNGFDPAAAAGVGRGVSLADTRRFCRVGGDRGDRDRRGGHRIPAALHSRCRRA